MKYKINTISLKNIEKVERYIEGELTDYIPVTEITNIRDYAFYNYRPSSILIPKSVKYIGVFANLGIMYYEGTLNDWCNIEFGNAYAPSTKGNKIYIRDDNGDIEYNNLKYSLVEGSITISSNIIPSNCFLNYNLITRLVIENTVNKIESYAFGDCQGLEEIVYNGTISEWENIDKEQYWLGKPKLLGGLTPATLVQCSDGEVSV